MTNLKNRRIAVIAPIGLALVLGGCSDFKMPEFKLGKGRQQTTSQSQSGSVQLVERDVEAPQVFQVNEEGLWDGRPSLGGVWVAYPDVGDPERVIIRNEANGKFVIGALFRRERNNPGPKLQVSSDAAAALEVIAGQPTVLNVTALRKEQVPENAPAQDAAVATGDEDVTAQTLGPIAAAAAAIEEAEADGATPTAQAQTPAPQAAAPAPSALAKPYVQIGIFSVQDNATRNAKALQDNGIVPVVKAQESNGKKFWRVLAGPAASRADMRVLLKKVHDMGYSDAYAVTH